MDTAEAIGAEMPKGEKKKRWKKKHFSHCQFKPRRAEPTDADRQRKKPKRERERKDVGSVATPS